MSITDSTHARASLSAALSLNERCVPPSRFGRTAIASHDDVSDQIVVLVSAEEEGYVYGHLFADEASGLWWSLFVFSSAFVMKQREHATVTEFNRVIVRSLNCEPLYTFAPGDVSAVTSSSAAAVRALARMIRAYSNRALSPKSGAGEGVIDGGLFEAYRVLDQDQSIY